MRQFSFLMQYQALFWHKIWMLVLCFHWDVYISTDNVLLRLQSHLRCVFLNNIRLLVSPPEVRLSFLSTFVFCYPIVDGFDFDSTRILTWMPFVTGGYNYELQYCWHASIEQTKIGRTCVNNLLNLVSPWGSPWGVWREKKLDICHSRLKENA